MFYTKKGLYLCIFKEKKLKINFALLFILKLKINFVLLFKSFNNPYFFLAPSKCSRISGSNPFLIVDLINKFPDGVLMNCSGVKLK